jgi:parallel beta-helix repeat protein
MLKIKKNMFTGILALTLVFNFSHTADSVDTIDLYVATNGSDQNPGTIHRPFASLERARDAVRNLKQSCGLPAGSATVQIRGGTYYLAKTFELTEDDSGTKQSPIIYRQYNNEEVRLLGGKEITGFSPVNNPEILERLGKAVRGKILQADLKVLGITDFGEISARGFAIQVSLAGIELFFQNKPMTLARWPNNDWSKIAATPAGQSGGKFTYEGDRPNGWAKADDIWLHGYWTWDWADTYAKVKSINIKTREIMTQEPHHVFGYKTGQRYYALNILEELDEPGEWYLDRKSGILYFWPPAPLDQGKAVVSILPTIISMNNVSHVTIQGITLECCRGIAVDVKGGTNNSLAGCTLRNIGTNAVNIDGGSMNGIVGCDIYNCGDSGIRLSGGDRKTLTPAGNYAINNQIHDFSRWVRTYQPGISVYGVGNRVSNNLIYNSPHIAIMLHGNDHTIEFNEIHHVCMETSDAGAFYMGRDYSQRGNVIRYNYFHELGTADVQAIYLDDYTSGTTVYGNVVYKAGRGVLIGGGRDNTVRNNIFVDVKNAIHLDARGLSWAKTLFNGTDTMLIDGLNAIKFREPPYSKRYPELLKLYDRNPALPEGNSIVNNIAYGGKWLELLDGVTDKVVRIEGNLFGVDPGFVDQKKKNFQLRKDSPAYKLGFQRIPMEKIGLYKDKYRKTLPSTGN